MKRIERRLYAAMLTLCNDEGVVRAQRSTIVKQAGYNADGGGITYAFDKLEAENKITKLGEKEWKIDK